MARRHLLKAIMIGHFDHADRHSSPLRPIRKDSESQSCDQPVNFHSSTNSHDRLGASCYQGA